MKTSASNIVKGFCAILLLGILAVSCRKDPIFDYMSHETAPIPPRIEGSPTNMVVFEREYQYLIDPTDPDFDPEAEPEIKTIALLFVASGRLHWYGSPNPASESPKWDKKYGIPQPGGKIISLAVTQDRLYALCLSSSSLRATLRYIGHSHDDTWHTITGVNKYPLIQSIYADFETGRLFAGARSGEKYALLYLDKASDTLKILFEGDKDGTEMLSGAAYRDKDKVYYLCTRGKGIFRVNKSDLDANTINETSVLQLLNIRKVEIIKPEPEPEPGDEPPEPLPEPPPETPPETQTVIQERGKNLLFMGMIKLNDLAESIIAIERNSALYEILTDDDLEHMYDDVSDLSELPPELSLENLGNCRAFSQIFQINEEDGKPIRSVSTGGYAMGALALWEDANRKLLVAGRQGSLYSTSYNNGYIEFHLTSDGSFNKIRPRNSIMFTADEDRYSTSLEKQPINHLFQAPKEIDNRMTFFASTQAAGLWSYRDRPSNGGWQWNAED